MSEWKKVTKEEFDAFLFGYPRKLERDYTSICEPPLLSFNDFDGGKVWPESMVAKVKVNTEMRGYPAYRGEPDDYYIKT